LVDELVLDVIEVSDRDMVLVTALAGASVVTLIVCGVPVAA